jgi:hypothetical protein
VVLKEQRPAEGAPRPPRRYVRSCPRPLSHSPDVCVQKSGARTKNGKVPTADNSEDEEDSNDEGTVQESVLPDGSEVGVESDEASDDEVANDLLQEESD